MARNPKDDLDDTPKPSFIRRLMKLFILFFILCVVGAGAYGGAAYFFKLPPFEVKTPTPEELAAERLAREIAEREQRRDIYIECGDPFTFNVQGLKRTHTAQITVCLTVYGQDNAELVRKHLALINSAIFVVLSNQSFEDLLMPSGKQRLKRQILDAVRKKLTEVVNDPLVNQVLFTGFVMQ